MQTFRMGKTGKRMPWLIGAIAVGLMGTVAIGNWVTRNPAPKTDLTTETVAVTSQDLTLHIKANGVVQAVRKTNLSPKDGGRIIELLVDEGDRVAAGQLIARTDSRQVEAQVSQYRALLAKAQAELSQKRSGVRPEEIAAGRARLVTAEATVAQAAAQLNRAQEELRRHQMLAQTGAIAANALETFQTKVQESQANLAAQQARQQEQAETLTKLQNGTRPPEIAQAEAEVAQVTAQLQAQETLWDNTLIRAPFAGTITRRFAQVGDFVTPTTSASSTDGATSTSIAELSQGLEIEAKVPEASMAKIKLQQAVEIRSKTYPDQQFTGTVRLIAPRAIQENNVTSFRVKVALKTGTDQLKSGMNVELAFVGEPIANAITVPLATVTKKDGQDGVWVVDDQQAAKFRPVSLGITAGDQVQIVQGLAKGDRVFLSPPPGQVIPGVDTVGNGN
jgi:HlyD family secretion protein